MKSQEHCWICLDKAKNNASSDGPDTYRCACPRCGNYTYAATPHIFAFEGELAKESLPRATLSHAVRKMTTRREWARVPDGLVRSSRENLSLPTPAEQAENLIAFLGEVTKYGGRQQKLALSAWAAAMGSADGTGADLVIEHLDQRGLIHVQSREVSTNRTLQLSMEGWERYEEFKKGKLSRTAFMAMQFGDELLDHVYEDCFKPAVLLAGFELRRIDERAQAGLIDDRIVVGITTSRFLIADLTHENRGAYWEAGFAEGQRKPVIYSCEESQFKTKGTHFDTRNHHTVVWDADDLDDAAARLKATIRATLPDEAVMEDPSESVGQ